MPRVPPASGGGSFLHASGCAQCAQGFRLDYCQAHQNVQATSRVSIPYHTSALQQHGVKAVYTCEMSGAVRPTASGGADTLRSLPVGRVALSAPPPFQVGRGRDPLDFLYQVLGCGPSTRPLPVGDILHWRFYGMRPLAHPIGAPPLGGCLTPHAPQGLVS